MNKEKKLVSESYFYLIYLLFFLSDIMLIQSGRSSIQPLLCATLAATLYSSSIPIAYALFLLCCRSIIFYDTAFILLTLAILPFFLLLFLRNIINLENELAPYAFLILYLLYSSIINALFFGINPYSSYTLYAIFGNLGVMAIILKCIFKGKLDNRL